MYQERQVSENARRLGTSWMRYPTITSTISRGSVGDNRVTTTVAWVPEGIPPESNLRIFWNQDRPVSSATAVKVMVVK